MADQGFESSFVLSGLTDPKLTGSISAPVVTELAGPLTQMVIRTDEEWKIDVNWEVHGSLFSKPASLSFPFTGEWIVKAFLESIGPGKEYELPMTGGVASGGVRVNVNTGVATGDRRDYTATIKVPKWKDPTKTPPTQNPDGVEAGIYKLVVTITNESSKGVPGPIAGFYESGMLQIYDTQ